MLTREQLQDGLNEFRRIADEIRVKVHLASLDTRSYWEEVEPKLRRLEQALEHKGEAALLSVGEIYEEVGRAIRSVRDRLVDHPSPPRL